MKKITFTFLFIFALMIIHTQGFCQTENVVLDSQTKLQVVESISKMLNDYYVFPEKAKEMENYLNTKIEANEYDKITDPRAFSDQLTKDLQHISKDKHLSLNFSPKDASQIDNSAVGKKDHELSKEEIEKMRYENYGFKKIERLNGNIGYVDFRYFAPSDHSKETIASVMSFLSNCDAIIFDVTQNGGGDPTGVQMICSYFFDSNPVHLNDLYFRPSNRTDEFWTLKEVNGKRMPETPVYLLTSNYTFSGAEEFSYNLKNLKRATIVGETTGGGAHPGDFMAVDHNFVMFVPTGKAINPITKTNWEGVGVSPDIETSKDKALNTALLHALKSLSQKTTDAQRKAQLDWYAGAVDATLNPAQYDETTLQSFAGSYGERQITFENGDLYYQRTGRPKLKMIPMNENQFMFAEVDYFRIKFIKDSNGIISALEGIFDNGRIDKSERTN